jgi:hypothetical protein
MLYSWLVHIHIESWSKEWGYLSVANCSLNFQEKGKFIKLSVLFVDNLTLFWLVLCCSATAAVVWWCSCLPQCCPVTVDVYPIQSDCNPNPIRLLRSLDHQGVRERLWRWTRCRTTCSRIKGPFMMQQCLWRFSVITLCAIWMHVFCVACYRESHMNCGYTCMK